MELAKRIFTRNPIGEATWISSIFIYFYDTFQLQSCQELQQQRIRAMAKLTEAKLAAGTGTEAVSPASAWEKRDGPWADHGWKHSRLMYPQIEWILLDFKIVW